LISFAVFYKKKFITNPKGVVEDCPGQGMAAALAVVAIALHFAYTSAF